MLKKIIFAVLISATSFCFGQSNPGLSYGQVPTAGQWNSYFSNKMDYTAPGAAGNVFQSNGTIWTSGLLSGPNFGNQNANTIFSGPSSGSAIAPAFRSLVNADLPSFTAAGTGAIAQTYQGKAQQYVTLEDYGGSSIASGSVNTLALQKAVAAACGGTAGTNIVHILGNVYTITPDLSLTDAAGTNIAAVQPCSNLVVEGDSGATLIVSNGVSTSGSPTNYSIFLSTAPLSNITWRGITFDMNGANNTISPNAPSSFNNFTTSPILFSGGGSGSLAASGTDIVVDHCVFKNIPGVTAVGMMQSNITGVTLGKHWQVTNNRFWNNGINSDDHSSVYGWSDDVVISGNIFDNPTMVTTTTGPHVAYEVHGSRQTITNNVVNNYYQAFWIASNYTSQVTDVVIANNTWRVAGIGTDTDNSSSSSPGISGVLITGNHCEITDDTTIVTLKVCFQIPPIYSTSNFKITDNQGIKDGSTIGSSFFNITPQTVSGQTIDGIELTNNTARYFTVGASVSTNSTNGLGSITIKGNKFIDMTPGGAFTVPIGISGANISTQPVANLVIDGNEFIDTRGSPVYQYGIYLSGSIANLTVGTEAYEGMTVANYNEAALTVSNRIPVTAYSLAATNFSTANLSVNGHTITTPSSNSVMARTDAAQTFAGTQTFNGPITQSGTGSNGVITAGFYLQAGNATSGQGGNIRYIDDAGTTKWSSGLLGSAGATDYSIYDSTNSALRLDINSSTGLVTAENGLSAPQITSSVSTGTAPFVISSTTNVANLNASSLNGATFASPGAIGGTTPAAGHFTTINASGNISNTGSGNTISTGYQIKAGQNIAGQGGSFIMIDDVGTTLWQSGLNGVGGQTTYGLYDVVSGNAPFTVSASTDAVTFYTNPIVGSSTIYPSLSGISSSIGGSALLAGACASTTVSITGATTSMSVVATPVTYPGNGNYWNSYVSSSGVVTVHVCAAVAGTPVASIYNVRVIQ